MTQKVNGAAYSGIWVEKNVSFMKLTFNIDISAIVAANLTELGTTTAVSSGTVADSTFAVVESALVQALKVLELKATVLGISTYDASSRSVDVVLGTSEGWFSDINGAIVDSNNSVLAATAVPNATAIITTAGSAAIDAVGSLVTVTPTSVTFVMKFANFNGTLPVANGTTLAGGLIIGPGATSGAYPATSPSGTPGYYPILLATS